MPRYPLSLRSVMVTTAVAALLSACSEHSLAPDAPSLGVVANGGFPLVMLYENIPPQAEGAVTSSLQDAVARVRPGGTIRVHAGTYRVEGVVIDKPVILEGVGPGLPVFDAAGGYTSVFIRDVEQGTVTLRGIRMQGATGHNVFVTRTFDRVLIDAVEFHPSETGGGPTEGRYYGSGVITYDASGHSVVIQNSTFSGGAIGVLSSTPGVVVRNNRFVDQSNASIHGPIALIEGNQIDGCGTWWCMFIAPSPNGNARPVTPLSTIVRNNQITTRGRPRNAIQLWGGMGQGNVYGGEAEVSGNTITYTDAAGQPIDPNSYSDQADWGAALMFGEMDMMRADRNTIRNAYMGIAFQARANSPGATATGTDNVIERVRQGVFFWRVPSATFRRNDVTDYRIAAGSAGSTTDATCNWWGHPAGPSSTYLAPGQYTPWSATPIANRPSVQCPA